MKFDNRGRETGPGPCRHRWGRYEGLESDYAGICIKCGSMRADVDHGSFSGYARGCRCEPCVEHRARYDAERYRALRKPTIKERLVNAEAAIVEMLRATDELRDARNGMGHPGTPHDRWLCRQDEVIHDQVGHCAQCGGDEYGAEDALNRAVGRLRLVVGQTPAPWEVAA